MSLDIIRAVSTAKAQLCHPESRVCSRDLLLFRAFKRSSSLASLGMTVCMMVIAVGCGYHTAAHYNTLPKTIHVIAVPAIETRRRRIAWSRS